MDGHRLRHCSYIHSGKQQHASTARFFGFGLADGMMVHTVHTLVLLDDLSPDWESSWLAKSMQHHRFRHRVLRRGAWTTAP